MKVLHINAGLEDGGGKNHILSLLSQFDPTTAELLVMEDGIIAEEAKKLGIQVHTLKQQSRYDLSILKRLAQFINDHAFDIVHTHGARANFIFSMIRRKVAARWLITVHSDPTFDFMDRGIKGTLFTKLNLASLKKADHLIVVTDSLMQPLLELGIIPKKMTIIYNGLQFEPNTAKTYAKNDRFTLTCIARLHPIKGHDLLLESLHAAHFNDFRLNLVGDGDLKASLEKKAQQLNMQKNVHFLGFLNKPQVEETIAHSDITILASYNEGFPMVLLESANQKVPFIATDVGDIALLVPDESYGWCVPAKSVESLTGALNEAYTAWENNTLALKGERLYQLASKQFSLERFYQQTLALYETLSRS
ncbi:glycosyltransferase family 4 protein [Carnobacterium sp. ISL-102]|uniref:glycosyltransferase family 4 protein n=1 Tax=Carnobacterium sp. ISL-102 TaxID=2819142 RepID=UPI001BE8E3B8|nr:glycosyltransferase family 4 protein [Carnobacterium sp. ISL-102]MBT2731114.1 glycosyltransferase family 4 protein [Carnobacterium sp. ISL-102]